MKKYFVVALVWSAILNIGFTTSCGFSDKSAGDQRSKTETVSNAPVARSKVQGDDVRLQGTVVTNGGPNLNRRDSIEDSINSSSLPRIWLSFNSESGDEISRTELPEEAMKALNGYFTAYLHYCLIEYPNGPRRAPYNLDYDRALLRNANATQNKVMEIEIETPDGRRPITYAEAGRLISFVSGTAVDNYEGLISELR